MSGTVLGKSCLVLGVEFGMRNAKAAPGAASRDRDRDCSQQRAQCHGEFNAQVELKQGKHGHTKSPAPCELPRQLELQSGCRSCRRARPGSGSGAALPLPSPRAPQPQTLGHSRIPTGIPSRILTGIPSRIPSRIPTDTSCLETPPGTALPPGDWRAKLRLLSVLQDAQHWPHGSRSGVFQNTDTSEGEVSTLTQGFVVKVRIWKLFTPQWVIQTWLAQALVDLPQWKHCSDSKDLFRKWH